MKSILCLLVLQLLPSNAIKSFSSRDELREKIEIWVNGPQTEKDAIIIEYGEISQWQVSQVTNMSGVVKDLTTFDEDISLWNTSSVTRMDEMFFRAEAFNQPLDSWDTSSATNMSNMFALARSCNQPLDSWDTSRVANMESMFDYSSSFNQPLGSWDTSGVINMSRMFSVTSPGAAILCNDLAHSHIRYTGGRNPTARSPKSSWHGNEAPS